MGLEINKQDFQAYFANDNLKIEKTDIAQLNSIFDECDIDGNHILQNEEVPNFQKTVISKLAHVWNQVRNFIDGLAGQNVQQVQGPSIEVVECHRSEEAKVDYMNKLNEAKKILCNNAEHLGLTQKELEYVNKIDIESITNGPARYDRELDKVVFNINDKNEPNVGNFIKILMHEVTHGINKDDEYTQSQELACETRGLEVARKAYDAGLIDDFVVWGNKDQLFMLKDLDTNGQKTYLNSWIKNYSYLPK